MDVQKREIIDFVKVQRSNSPARQAVIPTGRLDAFPSSYSRSTDKSDAPVQERGNHL
jgi:hypothetical protein